MIRDPKMAGLAEMQRSTVLVLNAGSSSLKFALFDADISGQDILRAEVVGIGTPTAHLTLGQDIARKVGAARLDTLQGALEAVLSLLDECGLLGQIRGVGHRFVHGGPDCDCPMPVTSDLRARLGALVPLAPLHLPGNLAGVDAISNLRPDLAQVACFDTAFHHGLPRVAQMTGLPRDFETPELRRYGYHGLSYEFILSALERDGIDVAAERIIIAHLGNGASLAAIRGGRSVETTMGFSTIAGVPMGTRSGDIDPGLALHLLREGDLTVPELEDLLTNRAGLLGLSGESRNMAHLIDHHDEAAAEAIRYFCYHVRRHLVALTAPIEGLDRLVFTGGIGANAASVRSLTLAGLGYLGLELDDVANEAGQGVISAPDAPVTVEVRTTDEEAMIAAHVARLCPACGDEEVRAAS